jgi:hypothetical protein
MSGVNCQEFERRLVEAARGCPMAAEERLELDAHMEHCQACADESERQTRLSAAMGALAMRNAKFQMPPQVEQALLAEFVAVRRVPRRRFVYGVLGGAVAAILAVVWWMGSRPAPQVAPVVAVSVPPPLQATPLATVGAAPKHLRQIARPAKKPDRPFIAIPYTLPLEPWERAEVMRMDLPVAALIAAGYPTGMMDPTGSARADVLVGQDGSPRAIRLVGILN